MHSKSSEKIKISWIKLLYIILFAVFMLLIITEFKSLRGSINAIKGSNISFDALALLFIGLSFAASAATYSSLSIKKLKYIRTLFIEFGCNTLNKLLPAGIGGIGANFDYLKRSGNNNVQAATTVAINNSLGFIGNMILLGIMLFVYPTSHLHLHKLPSYVLPILVALIIALVIFILFSPGYRAKFMKIFNDFIKQLKFYENHPLKVAYALLWSICLTLCYVMALSFSLKAVGLNLPLGSIIIAYSFAVGLGAALPVPGGLGGVEAGLVGALVAFGISFKEAIVAVLVFRLISFWIPLIGGIPALIWARSKSYL